MRTRTLLRVLPLAFVLAWTNALAQDVDQRGWYVGLSVGQSKVDIDDSAITVLGATASSVSKDESDTGLKLYVGHQFNRNFALEGGWVDLGSFKVTRNVTAPLVGSLGAEIESSGFYLDALGILPVNQQFSVFGKLGIMYATTKSAISSTGAVVVFSDRNPEDSEIEFKFGLGVSYALTRSFAVRAEFERYLEVGTSETGEGDVNLISIGVTFRF